MTKALGTWSKELRCWLIIMSCLELLAITVVVGVVGMIPGAPGKATALLLLLVLVCTHIFDIVKNANLTHIVKSFRWVMLGLGSIMMLCLIFIFIV